MVRSLPSPPAGPRSFLPSVLLEQLRRNVSGNWRDGKEPVSGAFCHVDIFGMQQLTEQLKLSAAERVGDAREAALREQRRAGVLDALAACFVRLSAIAAAHGGDIVDFTGDGMLLLWPCSRLTRDEEEEAEDGDASPAEDQQRAVISACRCALELTRWSGTLIWDEAADAEKRRRMSVALARGDAEGAGALRRAASAASVAAAEPEHEGRLDKLLQHATDANSLLSRHQGDVRLSPYLTISHHTSPYLPISPPGRRAPWKPPWRPPPKAAVEKRPWKTPWKPPRVVVVTPP